MSGPSRSPAYRRTPWGLIGMLALVAVAEAVLACHALDFTRFFIHDWQVTGRAARGAASACSVLCFGDSQVKFGIIPGVIEREIGGRAYNLAVCDGQASSSYFLFNRVLKAGARPSAVVIDLIPHLLATGPRHNLRQWPELASTREGLDLVWTARHAGLGAALMLGWILPSVKDRQEIRGNIRAALLGGSGSRRQEIQVFEHHWRFHQGAQVCAKRPTDGGENERSSPAYCPIAWSCDPVNEIYLRRFLALAEARGIKVYWLLPPVVPRLQERREHLGLEQRYAQFVRTLQAEFPNLVVIDARRSGYVQTLFIDPLHLDRDGATALSASVASVLARSSSESARRGRWVALDAYSNRPDDASLEDIDQSLLALHVRRKGRR